LTIKERHTLFSLTKLPGHCFRSRLVQPPSLSSGTKGQPAREKLRLVQHK